jgi:hypothetical protein
LIEEFDDTDLKALEIFAKVAGSDMSCDGRQTISLRLDCVGIQRFKRTGDGILNPKYQSRYLKLAERISVWLAQLQPSMEHRSIRRILKSGLFPTFDKALWEACDGTGFQARYQALDQAVGKYLVALNDFMVRTRHEREVSSALDARCP